MKKTLFCLLALAACGQGTEISSGSYDQSCMTDVDCTPVYQGDVCVCGCENTAVNKSQTTRYQADLASLKMKCGPAVAVACASCSPRQIGRAHV